LLRVLTDEELFELGNALPNLAVVGRLSAGGIEEGERLVIPLVPKELDDGITHGHGDREDFSCRVRRLD
jgi:hypothetical protein